jgi:integrase
MSQATIKQAMPLMEFFETHFRPTKLNTSPGGTLKFYRSVIRSLSRHLARPALTTDLVDESINCYLTAGLQTKSIATQKSILLGMARFAFARRYLKDIPGIKRANDPVERSRSLAGISDLEIPEVVTLRQFFEIEFIEVHLFEIGSKTQRDYRRVIDRAAEYAGGEVTLAELSDVFFANFTNWMIDQGFRDKRTQKHRQKLRSMARAAQEHGYTTGSISEVDPLAKRSQGNRRYRLKLRGPNQVTRKRIAKAAALFATGSTLEEIGSTLGVTGHAVHNWRGRYLKLWRAAYCAAIDRAAAKLQSESAENARLLEISTFSKRAAAVERGLQGQGKTLVKADNGPAKNCPTLSELIANLASERAWGQGSVANYQHCVRTLERYMGKTLYADCFDRVWANRWLAELDQSDLKKATVAGYRRHLVALWKGATESGWCEEGPSRLRKIVVPHPIVDAWSVDQVNALLACAAVAAGMQTFAPPHGQPIRIPNSLLWRLIIRVMWDTGLRPGDAFALKRQQINDNGVLVLRQGKTKVTHVCKLHNSTLQFIDELQRPANELLIPWDKSSNARANNFRKLCLSPAGLNGELYTIRKSSASDVELHHPGMGGVHLGHNLKADVARTFYLKPELIAQNRPMPTELTGDLRKGRKLPRIRLLKVS